MESTLKDGKREFLIDEFSTIEFRNVWFRYPNNENYVLKGISLKLEKGKVYALLGLNGSGKTTLVKLLMRLYDPEKGNIFLDGVDIKEYSLQSLYRNIGVVFQDFVKYPLTVNENVGIGNIAYMNNMEYIKKAIAIAGLINLFRIYLEDIKLFWRKNGMREVNYQEDSGRK
ncbi:ATP-binding cassette domain-containing protein [Mediterraneibacter gnavus]|uniref:ATP-binding cassette domain-containing protein n=1 Tax=Mediterraneibacter gnavus TaxID=33038 RepID=A0A3E4UJY8_MEDGN|nr:ATP-binding cassette domain-containing protein [Mediterraneibacter gnavus]